MQEAHGGYSFVYVRFYTFFGATGV
jgi:hypothetical protein